MYSARSTGDISCMTARAACSRGRNVALGLLEGSLEGNVSLWNRGAALVSGVRGARCGAQQTCAHLAASTRCSTHTSPNPYWTHNLSQSKHMHSRYALHSSPACWGPGSSRSWSSVAAKLGAKPGEKAESAEPSDRVILSKLLVHIWPPDNLEFRARVVGALALLAGSKLLNIQV